MGTDVELGKASREPNARLEVRLVLAEDALHMAQGGEIGTGPSALALL